MFIYAKKYYKWYSSVIRYLLFSAFDRYCKVIRIEKSTNNNVTSHWHHSSWRLPMLAGVVDPLQQCGNIKPVLWYLVHSRLSGRWYMVFLFSKTSAFSPVCYRSAVLFNNDSITTYLPTYIIEKKAIHKQ